MALIVEDGTVVAGAESYVSVADADALLDGELGNDTWTNAETVDKERALRMATRIIDADTQYRGAKTATTNALEWPREYAIKEERDDLGVEVYFDDDEIPTELTQAVAQFAGRLIETPNYLRDLDEGRLVGVATGAGSKSYKSSGMKPEVLPMSIRLQLRSLSVGPEIPVRRSA